MSRFAMLTFATSITALGTITSCNDDMGGGVAFYGTSCGGTDCEFDSGQGFGYDGDTAYDAYFLEDSAIDASAYDADANDAGDDDAD